MKNQKQEYSVMVGIAKTAKNSAYLLIPFVLAIISGIPAKYSWIATPVIYFLKNLYENKLKP